MNLNDKIGVFAASTIELVVGLSCSACMCFVVFYTFIIGLRLIRIFSYCGYF